MAVSAHPYPHEDVEPIVELERFALRSGRTQIVEVIRRGRGHYLLLASRLPGEEHIRKGGLWVSRFAAPFIARGLHRFIAGDYPGAPSA